METLRVSEHDREYFRRIGEYKAESHRRIREMHLALPPLERLESSMDWCERILVPARFFQRLEADDPSPFYQRARDLGLISS